MESEVAHFQSQTHYQSTQLQSQSTKIGKIIGTVDNSLTTNVDQRGGKITETVQIENTDVFALTNDTILSLELKLYSKKKSLKNM